MPSCGYVVVVPRQRSKMRVAFLAEITNGSSMTGGNGMSLCCLLTKEPLLASLTLDWR